MSDAPELDRLLAPILGLSPAGSDLRYEPLYDKIKALRRAAEDKLKGAGEDGESAGVAPIAEWRAIRTAVVDALATYTKDLQLAIWLLDVDAQLAGFAGAAEALQLIRRLLEAYWDTVYPPIENDDEPLAARAGVLEWINARLPEILKGIPLSGRPQLYSLFHYELTERFKKDRLVAEGWPLREQIDAAMSATAREQLERKAGEIAACLEQLAQLQVVTEARVVTERHVGDAVHRTVLVSYSAARTVLENCHFAVSRALRAKSGPANATPDTPGSASSTETLPAAVGDGDGIWDRALQMVRQGQLDGLRLAQQHIEAASSGRERFLRQLGLSELCIQAGMHAFAYPILNELGRIIDQRRLGEWEDVELIRRTWDGLAAACLPLARMHPESVERLNEARERIGALVAARRPPESSS